MSVPYLDIDPDDGIVLHEHEELLELVLASPNHLQGLHKAGFSDSMRNQWW